MTCSSVGKIQPTVPIKKIHWRTTLPHAVFRSISPSAPQTLTLQSVVLTRDTWRTTLLLQLSLVCQRLKYCSMMEKVAVCAYGEFSNINICTGVYRYRVSCSSHPYCQLAILLAQQFFPFLAQAIQLCNCKCPV